MLSPPGWYPDPAPPAPGDPPLLRFWDGQQWTWQVAPAPGHVPARVAAPTYAAQPAQPPYAAQPPGPTTPDGTPLAPFWPRVAAHLIDALILGAASSVATFPIQLSMQRDMQALLESEPEPGELLSAYLDMFLPLVMWSALAAFVTWTLYTALMLRFKGATVGKMALGLGVRLRDRPGRLPWSSIAARVLTQHGYMLTGVFPWVYLALFWYPWLDCLWAAGDGKRQALHDKAARTNVVRTR
ncbi:MAG: hypothetical protein AVDCRST_MAG47-489 [uncultured Nocardioidaceae bacterium]|uniref:RDD domain-containing protein n=1 Tax=uncultured Nocardioidaceae bacterium TaxID=253824 RepID=A0A6J4MP64_9ACTN|nr:MAG: hypothetical protein AVDCRST_MAG47-489 [uncultured Nocardioidaceae bacterium]